jgi:ATP-dependent DNA ligase
MLLPILAKTRIIDEWYSIAEDLISRGQEGICLKQADSLYQPGKRNSSLMKIKQEEVVHLECVSLQYTTGEKGNPSLQLILRSKDKIEVPVRVGKHSDIAYIEEDNNRVLGKVIAVEIMCRSHLQGFIQPRLAEVWLTDKSVKEID